MRWTDEVEASREQARRLLDRLPGDATGLGRMLREAPDALDALADELEAACETLIGVVRRGVDENVEQFLANEERKARESLAEIEERRAARAAREAHAASANVPEHASERTARAHARRRRAEALRTLDHALGGLRQAR